MIYSLLRTHLVICIDSSLIGTRPIVSRPHHQCPGLDTSQIWTCENPSRLNSHHFHIIGEGHKPNSRGVYNHCKDSYKGMRWVYPQYKELRKTLEHIKATLQIRSVISMDSQLWCFVMTCHRRGSLHFGKVFVYKKMKKVERNLKNNQKDSFSFKKLLNTII